MGCQFPQSSNVNEPSHFNNRNRRTQVIDARKLSTRVIDKIVQNVEIVSNILSQQELKFASNCLKQHEFFSTLNQQQINQIVKTIVVATCKKNQYVFHQGDKGNNFFIIFKGQVDVQKNNVCVRTLGEGKSFGELALIFRTERTASIKCKGEQNIFYILKPACFRQCLKKMKISEFQKNRRMIQSAHIFNALSNKQKQVLSQHLKSIKFLKDEKIFNTGQPALSFYIISSGEVKIQIQNKQPIVLKKFDSFGENAFRNNSFRAGKAIAMTQTILCFLQKKDLQDIFGRKFDNIFHYNLKKWALIRSEYFKLDNYSINYLITKFQFRNASAGQVLVQSIPNGLIINLEGTINGKPPGTLFCQKSYKDRTLLFHPIIKDNAGSYAFISFQILDNTMRQIQQRKILKGYSNHLLPLQKQNFFCNLAKFKYVKELGMGQFGKVYLVKNNDNGNCLYALKCLSKQQIKKQGVQNCVIQQKRILSKIVFPYIVGYVQSFHDEKNIYILMQYIKGKQMFDVIRQMPFLIKNITSYFFGCILLAIQHLHQHNIIYRDIKPQNSVVDHTGKVFLIDLGTAKILKKQSFYKTFTLIGTPHYMAPEIMDGKGYSFQVDIWSLGILLYEFACGRLPFAQQDSDPYVVMRKVRNDQIKYPSNVNVSNDLKQLISMLLQKNPIVRSIKATFQRIKSASYLSDINWRSFLNGSINKPYIPRDFRNKNHNQTQKMETKNLSEFLYPKSSLSKQWIIKQWNQQFDFPKPTVKQFKQEKKTTVPLQQISLNQ